MGGRGGRGVTGQTVWAIMWTLVFSLLEMGALKSMCFRGVT